MITINAEECITFQSEIEKDQNYQYIWFFLILSVLLLVISIVLTYFFIPMMTITMAIIFFSLSFIVKTIPRLLKKRIFKIIVDDQKIDVWFCRASNKLILHSIFFNQIAEAKYVHISQDRNYEHYILLKTYKSNYQIDNEWSLWWTEDIKTILQELENRGLAFTKQISGVQVDFKR